MHCLSCQYDLQNLTEHRCPECGRIFDPNDDRTFQSPASSRLRLRVTSLALLLFAACAIGLPFVVFIIQLIRQD